MSLFQKSVVNKYLRTLDNIAVEELYYKFISFYGDKQRLENIKLLKEENYQEGFLREIFVQVLGYIINPDNNYNLTTEFKNQTDSRKADGAILKNGKAIGVIELKSTKTKNLESIKEQAFSYKHHQDNCRYIITSNFEKLRFYIDNATEFEEFNLFNLNANDFKILYLFLSKESIFNDIPIKLKEESKIHEENISEKLYEDYSHFKKKIFDNLVKNNPQYDKLILFKKSQKLLDRFLFILFAEDSGLLPPNTISKIIEQWKQFKELDEPVALFSRFTKLFHHLNVGHQYKTYQLYPYNGGLFEKDEILDNAIIDDDVLWQDSLKLSKYNFQTEVDVNILGHIFEHSISDIEELTAELEGKSIDKKKTKRKKEGVFYTPKYITKYIVDHTIGILCDKKKKELELNDIDISIQQKSRTSAGKLNRKAKNFLNKLNEYREYLISLKIIDPACGSGAFLNQALEFLINEHNFIDEYRRTLEQDSLGLHNIERSILENNLYGVDINEESVEIAKLSLWLRTAEKGRKLSDLNNNIKCGNSLIDDPEIAGEKAFNWEKEFPQVFNPQQVKAVEMEKEENLDYLSLIEKNAKLAQEKAEKSTELSKEAINYSKEAINYSKKVYEYTQKQKAIVSEPGELYGLSKGGFDVVIGNPPYINFKLYSQSDRNYYRKKYSPIFDGKADLLYFFYYKGISLLKPNGLLGFITSRYWLEAEYAMKLRNFITLNTSINEIIDFKNVTIFENVGTKSSIIILKKTEAPPKYNFIYKDFSGKKITDVTENKNINLATILYSNIANKKKWSFYDVHKMKVIEKIKLNSIALDEIADCKQGIVTGLDKAFVSINKKDFLNVPEKYIKKWIKVGDLFRYSLKPNEKRYLIYVNDIKSIENFPLLVERFSKYKTKLSNRREAKNGKIRWFDLQWGREKRIFENKKLICRFKAPYNTFVYDDGFHFSSADTTIVILKIEYKDKINLKYLLALLNSKLLDFYFKSYGKLMDYRYEYYPGPVSKIVIKMVDTSLQKPFIEKADEMLDLKMYFNEKFDKFINRIKTDLEINRITNKIKEFYLSDFKSLLFEIKRQKVKLSLNHQDEWEDYFNNYKTELLGLQEKINKTDNEIDQMVYKLYELTDEEIKIVEEKI